MLTYEAFITEIHDLAARVPSLIEAEHLSEDAGFRRWRHELQDIIGLVERNKYSVNCGVRRRAFDLFPTDFGRATYSDRKLVYQRDLAETQSELELLIDRYKKYGDPQAPAHQAAATVASAATEPDTVTIALKAPETITVAWIWHNASVALWFQAITALIVVFGLGVTVGQSSLYQEFSAKLTASSEPAPVKPPAPPGSVPR